MKFKLIVSVKTKLKFLVRLETKLFFSWHEIQTQINGFSWHQTLVWKSSGNLLFQWAPNSNSFFDCNQSQIQIYFLTWDETHFFFFRGHEIKTQTNCFSWHQTQTCLCGNQAEIDCFSGLGFHIQIHCFSGHQIQTDSFRGNHSSNSFKKWIQTHSKNIFKLNECKNWSRKPTNSISFRIIHERNFGKI